MSRTAAENKKQKQYKYLRMNNWRHTHIEEADVDVKGRCRCVVNKKCVISAAELMCCVFLLLLWIMLRCFTCERNHLEKVRNQLCADILRSSRLKTAILWHLLLFELHKHCCVMETGPGKEQGREESSQLAHMWITYTIQSPEHRWRSADSRPRWMYLVVLLFWRHPGGEVWEHNPPSCGLTLCHLDGSLPLDREQGDVGHADEGPLLVGPEHDDGASLGGLGRHVEVGEANTTQVRGQTYEDVPVRARGVRVIQMYLCLQVWDVQCLQYESPHQVILVCLVPLLNPEDSPLFL